MGVLALVPVLLTKDFASLDPPSSDGWVDMGFLHLLSGLLAPQGEEARQEGEEVSVQGWDGEPGDPVLGKALLLGLPEASGSPPPRGVASQYPETPDGKMSKDSQPIGLMLQPEEGSVGKGEPSPSKRWASEAVKGEVGVISDPLMRRSREGSPGPEEGTGVPGAGMEPAADNECPSRPAPARFQGVASSLNRVLPGDGPPPKAEGFMGGREENCGPGSTGGGPLQGMAGGGAVQECPQMSSTAPPAFTDPHAVQRGEGRAGGEGSAPMERSQGLSTFRPGGATGPATVHSMSLTLETEHLGRVHMRVKVKGEEVGTLMLTEGLHQKRILEAGAHHLHQDLQQQGLFLRQMEVQVGSGGPGGDTGRSFLGDSPRPRGLGQGILSSPEGQGEDEIGSDPQPHPDGGRIHVVI